ncbi:hypothetical protein GCM10009662_66320 [Catellatospora coxensis]|uniref:Uncharacterized protein n=1 Tax=Catellatospora coxensis TaxID=310354 RepID=A0A8J3P6W5_9ACTN|nr:hypothetical protein Cco03nite_06410 [Catellatospora coxensis]
MTVSSDVAAEGSWLMVRLLLDNSGSSVRYPGRTATLDGTLRSGPRGRVLRRSPNRRIVSGSGAIRPVTWR